MVSHESRNRGSRVSPGAGPPGPQPRAVLGWRGNLLAFYRDPIRYLSLLYQQHGELAALVRNRRGIVAAFGVAHTDALLHDPALVDLGHAGGLDAVVARGVAAEELANGEFEAWLRAVIALHTREMLDRWAIGRQLDARYVLLGLSTRIAAHALLGLDRAEDVAEIQRVLAHWKLIPLPERVARASVDPGGTIAAHVGRLARRLSAVVQARIEERGRAGVEPVARGSLLDRLRGPGGALPTAALIEQVALLLIAGHETTASALTWALFLLSQYPAFQAELHADLRAAAFEQVPMAEQADRAPLLERTVLESLRLLPPCSVGLRVCVAPTMLGDVELVPGSTVVYSPYINHRLPDLFFLPRKFRPERWLHIEPPRSGFLPLGTGLRTSLGAEAALMEIRLILALLLERFVFGLAPGVSINRSFHLTLMPRDGMPMIIAPPDRAVKRREARGTIGEMLDV